MKVRCHITAKDIRESEHILMKSKENVFRCEVCPVARAIKRKLKNIYKVSVALTLRIYKGSNQEYKVLLPDSASRFINNYDNGKNVRPTNFTIDIPSMYLR